MSSNGDVQSIRATTAGSRWIRTAECQFFYTDTELVFWMPLPTNFPTRRAALSDADLPEPPFLSEDSGSGI